jgi:hypothetical protein
MEMNQRQVVRIRQYDKKWPVREGWFFAYLHTYYLPKSDRTGKKFNSDWAASSEGDVREGRSSSRRVSPAAINESCPPLFGTIPGQSGQGLFLAR